MLALSEIIDFLLTLMRDENARAEFEQDPDGTLARAGLEGITGQDVSDARLQLADSGAVSADSGSSGGGGHSSSPADGADPIHQINYTTQHYHAEASAHPDAGDSDSDLSLAQQSNSFFFQTFNSDDDVTIVNDSFNDVDASSTDVTVTNIEGSFNSDDDVTAIDADNSFNTQEDNDVVAIQDNDTFTEDNDSLVVNAEDSFNDTEQAAPVAADPIAPGPIAPDPIAETPPETPVEDLSAEQFPAEEPQVEEPLVEASPLDEPFDEIPEDPADDPSGDAADIVPV